MGNLFAYRATDPQVLKQVSDPIGPENDLWLMRMRAEVERVIAAWGNLGKLHNRALTLARDLAPLYCLGCNASGAPKHPLYVPGNTEVVLWTA